MATHLKVKNYEKFQHYKDRNPPWIKLYNELLDDYAFGCLQDASKWLAVGIWLLASRYDNAIPNDPEWIGKRINASEPVDLSPLLSAGFVELCGDASNTLASCHVSAMPETETEREKDMSSSAKPNGDAVREVFDYWRERCGHTRATLTADRRAKIKARLRTFSPEQLCNAIDAAAADPFYQGDNDRQKRYDFPETIFKTDGAAERLMLAPNGNGNGSHSNPVVIDD